MVDKATILNLAEAQNPWWKDRKNLPLEKSWPRREVFADVRKELDLPRPIVWLVLKIEHNH